MYRITEKKIRKINQTKTIKEDIFSHSFIQADRKITSCSIKFWNKKIFRGKCLRLVWTLLEESSARFLRMFFCVSPFIFVYFFASFSFCLADSFFFCLICLSRSFIFFFLFYHFYPLARAGYADRCCVCLGWNFVSGRFVMCGSCRDDIWSSFNRTYTLHVPTKMKHPTFAETRVITLLDYAIAIYYLYSFP